MIYKEETAIVKTRQFSVSFTSFFTHLILFTIILAFAGCLRRPLLLRNRPNVPPPSLDPNSDEIPVTYGTEVIASPPVVIEVNEEITQVPIPISIPEIKDTPVTYTVVKKDSFWKIARKFGVSKDELAECNNLDINKPLKIGTVLVIPPGGAVDYKPSATPEGKVAPATQKITKKAISKPTPAVTDNDGIYTVQSRDSLWKISRKFNISTKALTEANGIDPTRPIMVGSKLVIPGAGTAAPKKIEKTTTSKETVPELNDDPIDKTPVDPINKILEDAKAAAGDKNKSNADEIIDGLAEAADTAANPLPDDLFTDEVLPGETVQEIAEQHGFTEEELRAVNPGLPANGKLEPFTSIRIPNKKH